MPRPSCLRLSLGVLSPNGFTNQGACIIHTYKYKRTYSIQQRVSVCVPSLKNLTRDWEASTMYHIQVAEASQLTYILRVEWAPYLRSYNQTPSSRRTSFLLLILTACFNASNLWAGLKWNGQGECTDIGLPFNTIFFTHFGWTNGFYFIT